jgi:hypothetical protein
MEITISRRNEYGEYPVKVKGNPDADYFTDDITDARRTARAMGTQAGVAFCVNDRSRVKGAESYAVVPKR